MEPEYLSAYEKLFSSLAIREVIVTSQDRLGFFTQHPPRLFEYPWIVAQLIGDTPIHAADLGAGVSPVPLMLAEAGNAVTTVDLSNRTVRIGQDGRITEWGFLDYAVLHPAITSHNQSFEEVAFADQALDVVYSISVIEHIPARLRRRIFARIGQLLPVGGRFVATLDLRPGTRDLWNRDRKRIVDATGHGTLDDLLMELKANRLMVEHLQIERGLPGSATDVVALACVQM